MPRSYMRKWNWSCFLFVINCSVNLCIIQSEITLVLTEKMNIRYPVYVANAEKKVGNPYDYQKKVIVLIVTIVRKMDDCNTPNPV